MAMRAWLERFMYGRYGQDDLNGFLSIFALILCIGSLFTLRSILTSLAMVSLFFCVFRMLSRNAEQRRQENLAFLRVKGNLTRFFSRTKTRLSQSKTHRFYRCPSCKQQLRVPKGKGRISIRCPKCGTTFEKKT
jgi:DNA-directed RNA polymerase subunit RPC12/RpoP